MSVATLHADCVGCRAAEMERLDPDRAAEMSVVTLLLVLERGVTVEQVVGDLCHAHSAWLERCREL